MYIFFSLERVPLHSFVLDSPPYQTLTGPQPQQGGSHTCIPPLQPVMRAALWC